MDMRKKLLISLLVMLVISGVIFFNRYKSDIYLFYHQSQFEDGFSVDHMVLAKASEFIPRISHYYSGKYSNNHTSIGKVDNYFHKKCKIVIDDNDYTYSKDVKDNIIEYNRNKNDMIIFPTSSNAEILNHKKDELDILVSGKLVLASIQDISQDKDLYNGENEIYYEYKVTFKKQFLFVWKATYFTTESELIANFLM